MEPRKRRLGWLAAALALLALAAWLMASGDEEKPPPPEKQIAFPRGLRPAERARLKERRTLHAPVAKPAPPGVPAPPPPPARDPVLAALPPRGAAAESTAVVFEANALRHSPLGQLFLDCLLSEGELADLERLREETGVDLLEDLDRVAVSGDVLVVSGHFSGAKWDTIGKDHVSRGYGERGAIFEPPEGGGGETFATWGGQLLLVGDSPAELEAAIDRMEGRADPGVPAIPEHATYGEIYGVVGAADLAKMMPPEQAELAERLRSAAEQVELHVDATGDVAIVAELGGPDPEQVRDLGKTFGAALALGRLKAQADGEEELAELLDLARVQPGGDGAFRMEVALPLELVKRKMGPCKRGEGAVGGAAAAEGP